MPKVDRHSLLFSLNCFAAGMMALYFAFSIGLPRPYWALITVYITSQPIAGAVRSKAVYRLTGTLIGAAAAVVLVPMLVGSPFLLSLALSLWVAGCLVVSLLDRTPRSYLMMLAGYTAAIVGFASVTHPEAIFDVAVARVEEIGLGIVCAALMHSLIFPRPVGDVIQERLSQWQRSADHGLLDLLRGEGAAERKRDRRQLAAAASEISILATHLPFDTSRMRESSAAVQAIHERMLLLIPLLSGLGDRLQALAEAGGLTDAAQARFDEAAAWLESGAPHERGLVLAAALRDDAVANSGGDWRDLLIESLMMRLADAVIALGESHALLRHLHVPDVPAPVEIAGAIAAAVKRPLHSDVGLALRSGATTFIALMITCALWIGTGWAEGAGAAAMCGVFCALFATHDDPAPAILGFGVFILAGMVLAMVYQFAIFEAIDGFPLLATALFPGMFVGGLYLADAKTAGNALAACIGFFGGLALEQTFTADFADFLNGNLGQFVGLFIAILVVRAMRSMTAEASVERMLRLTWTGIASLAGRRRAPHPAHVAGLIVDRLALLAPGLALRQEDGDAVAEEGLRDLRVALNLMEVQRARAELDTASRARVDGIVKGVGEHYAGLARGGTRTPPEALLHPLDDTLSGLALDSRPAARRAALGLVGLRRNLLPTAAPFVAGQEQAA